MKTTLTPRDYQMNAVTTICNLHNSRRNSRIVLAAATGSGKTEMAIMIINNFIRRRLGRVLVITHHTNIIKSNFIDRLNTVNVNFTYSDTNTNADCFIAIRSNSLNRVDVSDFDLLVVDEAHQNYFAKTIQSIASDITHQVLLTATPSKFVRAGGFDILPIARLDIPNEHFANLSFRVVNAETSTTTDSYNSDNVIKSDVKFHRTEVKSMCDSVIPYLDDNKKLFICKDIEQAKSTAVYLTSLGIVTKVSDSKSDPDSLIADSFKSGDLNSLCVVDRMRVGYSDNNLYHTVDMSFTHNPDVIMQILSRSNRGNQSQSKTYIKVTNDTLNVRTRVMLSIAISLFRADNVLSFDGTFTSVNVPVTKQSAETRQTGSPSSDWFIPDSVDIVDFFNNCDFVSSSDIIRKLNTNMSYEYCLEQAKNYSTYNAFKAANRSCYMYILNNDLVDKFCADSGFTKKTYKRVDYTTFTDDELIALRSQYNLARDFQMFNKKAHIEMVRRGIKNNYMVTCSICSTTFLGKRSNKYCPDCNKSVKLANNRAYKLKIKSSK